MIMRLRWLRQEREAAEDPQSPGDAAAGDAVPRRAVLLV
jgi:hypothetical protein